MNINYKTVCKEAKKNINNFAIEDYAGYSPIVKAIYYILHTKYGLVDINMITKLFNIKIKNPNGIWEEAETTLVSIYREVNSKTLLTNE